MHSWLERPLRGGKDADEWKLDDQELLLARITELYEAGRPLFSRDVLQKMHDQLQGPLKRGDVIPIEGLDGTIYEYPVKIGDRRHSLADETGEAIEYEMYLPHPHYAGFDSLKDRLEWSTSRAFCSVLLGHWARPVNQAPDSVEKVDASMEFFEKSRQEWEGSGSWKQIESTLRSLTLPTKITKIIGMACGTFSIRQQRTGYRRSAIQHAFLLSVKQTLQDCELAADEVPCYAQDPAYCETDRIVLDRSDVQVVTDPEGFLQMDGASVVFSCSPNICVKEIVADIARPAVLIWCRVYQRDSETRVTDPNSPRVVKMIETFYQELPFPSDPNFTDMRIYVRKTG